MLAEIDKDYSEVYYVASDPPYDDTLDPAGWGLVEMGAPRVWSDLGVDGSGVIVPSGAKHNVINTSKTKNLKLYTIYSPPEHQDKVVRKTKQEAIARPEEYDGKPTEK